MRLNKIIPFCEGEALNLLENLLQLDPKKRCTAKEAMSHAYFTTVPLPCKKAELPVP